MGERDIFIAALQLEDAARRQAYLDEACAGRPELRQQVEELLRLYEGAGSFLEAPAAGSAATTVFAEPAEHAPGEAPGAVVGRYKLLQPVGEGGMGAVWMAQQTEPVRRLVALKLIKAGMDSRQVLARFEQERQALALMDHPNIAKVLDGGATPDGRPYFVMDLVPGVPITRYCDEHRLTPRQRLELFVAVCQAVQHAHTKGVIHRDIKPSNVLVAPYDGRPVPKVIDFGVAKAAGQQLTDRTLITGFGTIVGTLEYMSPEQAEVNQLDVDTRSDVYALGVLLYELLAGSPPFTRRELERAGLMEMLRLIREQEPSKPSAKLSTAEGLPTLAANRGTEPAKLTRLVRGELDWIVMKALEKDRSRRYETADGFAQDVRRYLADEPVQACPPSAGYRLGKLLRRHKGPLLATALVLLALVGGIIGTTWGMIQATEEATERGKAESQATQAETRAKQDRDFAVAQRDRARDQRYATGMFPVARLWREGGHLQVRRLLDALRPEPDEPDLRGFEWHYQDRLCRGPLRTLTAHYDGHQFGKVKAIAFSPDGRWLASCGDPPVGRKSEEGGGLLLCDVATGQEVRRFHDGNSRPVQRVAFSPDGKTLASCDYFGTTVRLWDVASGRRLHTLNGRVGESGCLTFSPDGRLLAASDNHAVKLWEVASGQEVGSWKSERSTLVTFHPEGQLLLVTRSAVTLHEPATGKVVRSLPLGAARTPAPEGYQDERDAAAVSADGHRLAVADGDGIRLWDLTRGMKIRVLEGHARKDTNGLSFSPDGQRLASAGRDGAVEVWDLRDSPPRRSTLPVLEEGVDCVAFSPDGLRLAAAGHDGAIRILDAASTGQEARVFQGVASKFGGCRVAFTPDGGQFLILPYIPDHPHGMPYLCDAVSGQKLPGQSGGKGPVAYSPDGRWLAAGHKEGIRVWDATTHREVRTIHMTDTCARLTFAGNGRLVAILLRQGATSNVSTVKVWDAVSGQELAAIPERAVVSPDGRWLACRADSKPPQENAPGELHVWDLDKWRPGEENPPVHTLKPHSRYFSGLAYSPDGKLLATTGQDLAWAVRLACGPSVTIWPRRDLSPVVKLWDAATLKEVGTLPWPEGVSFEGLTFSPDGRFLAAGLNRRVKVWDLTGRELFDYQGNEQDMKLSFSPDGRFLAAGGRGYARVWEVTGREVVNHQSPWDAGQPRPRINVAFSPDGAAVAAIDVEGATKVWDLATGRERFRLKTESPPPAGFVEAGISIMFGSGVAFSPDGRTLATGTPVARLWDATTGAEVATPGGPPGRVLCMDVSRVGRRVATGGEDMLVRVWDPDGWKPLGAFERHTGPVSAVAFSPDGRLLASGGGGEVRVWDLSDLRVGAAQSPRHRLKGRHKVLAFSPDGQRLVSVGEDSSVKVWDVVGGQELSSAGLARGMMGVALSPDGQLLACSGEDNAVRLWDLSRGQEVCTLTVDDKQRRARNTITIQAVTFSPDGRRLAAAGMGMIRVWDVRTFQELYTIASVGQVGALAFSPDGGRLVAVGIVGSSRSSTPTRAPTTVTFAGADNVVIYDGRELTSEQQVEREAVALLDQLFNRPLPRKAVLGRLRADPALSEPVRQEALRLADHYQEESDPKRYADAARLLARSAHLPAAWHRQALSQAEAAAALAPSDRYCVTALGMAQYRLGQYAEAQRTLTRANHLSTGRFGNVTLADHVLLALVRHRLGHKEAREMITQLPPHLQSGVRQEEEEFGLLRYEAELLIKGTPPPWPAGEGTPPAPGEKPKP